MALVDTPELRSPGVRYPWLPLLVLPITTLRRRTASSEE
jgi:hypothetical protein